MRSDVQSEIYFKKSSEKGRPIFWFIGMRQTFLSGNMKYVTWHKINSCMLLSFSYIPPIDSQSGLLLFLTGFLPAMEILFHHLKWISFPLVTFVAVVFFCNKIKRHIEKKNKVKPAYKSAHCLYSADLNAI